MATFAGALAAALALAVMPFPPRSPHAQEATPGDGAAPAETGEAAADPAADLAARRQSTRAELDELSKSITLSNERSEALKKSIEEISRNSSDIREALVSSATKRKDLERRIADGEKRLAALRLDEATIHGSLRERRGVLAEVLAALQRMGRNPPPALLVTPEDALSSVRSAILLGAVVPGIRHETDKLATDLAALARTMKGISDERASLTSLMTASLEEDRRMNLLLQQNSEHASMSAKALEEEQAKAEELARRAASLQDLIASLENQIGSVRDAALAARSQDDNTPLTIPPDKNRIAPAYPFSKLVGRLELPASGDIVRNFGDPDGTGHDAQGMTIATATGAVITAPADGWVVYAGAFRSYGQMVILNPGDGFHIVLSGMDRVNVRQGQFVVAGEPLAVMGEKRVASAAALALVTDRPSIYIEFRQNGKPVDSRPWWTALQLGKARNDS